AEFAAMYGYYICSDYVSGNTWLIKSNGAGGWNTILQSGLPGNIAGYGEAENGDLYTLSRNGVLYKVITSTVLPVTLLDVSATAFNGYNEITWRTVNEQNVSFFEIEFGTDAVNFTVAGRVNAINIPPSNNYSFRHTISLFTKLFYRLKITDRNGRISYSDTVSVDKKLNGVLIYPIPVLNSQLNVISEKPVEFITVFSADGKKVFQRVINNLSGAFPVTLPHLQSGIYYVRIKLKDEYITEKIVVHQTR
ncbi:MAG TPA: T9SS type A sorting domain-containing protein, partial [Ferruginibacter sp.]|nr:T9SS type A sorting domain-containing protein [Ferruginibacter sp.]